MGWAKRRRQPDLFRREVSGEKISSRSSVQPIKTDATPSEKETAQQQMIDSLQKSIQALMADNHEMRNKLQALSLQNDKKEPVPSSAVSLTEQAKENP